MYPMETGIAVKCKHDFHIPDCESPKSVTFTLVDEIHSPKTKKRDISMKTTDIHKNLADKTRRQTSTTQGQSEIRKQLNPIIHAIFVCNLGGRISVKKRAVEKVTKTEMHRKHS